MALALRAVLDTNVLLAAARSNHVTSPTAEILDRWQRREFQLLVSLDTLSEYAEKLLSHGVAASEADARGQAISSRAVVHHALHGKH